MFCVRLERGTSARRLDFIDENRKITLETDNGARETHESAYNILSADLQSKYYIFKSRIKVIAVLVATLTLTYLASERITQASGSKRARVASFIFTFLLYNNI